jgi:hypothetical protein
MCCELQTPANATITKNFRKYFPGNEYSSHKHIDEFTLSNLQKSKDYCSLINDVWSAHIPDAERTNSEFKMHHELLANDLSGSGRFQIKGF